MPRLVFHVRQHNKWSIFVQYYNNMFHVFGQRSFNKNTVFHTTFVGYYSVYLYLEEILDFTKNRYDYSITLFYSDLTLTLNPVISFSKAQKEMRNKYPTEPEKWAGFVLVR